MNHCPNCGVAVSETARYCCRCGAELTEAPHPPLAQPNGHRGRCKYCGHSIPLGSNPCPHCGHELRWSRATAPVVATRAEPTAAPSNQEQTVDLAQDLNNLGGWGFNNVGANTLGLVFPGLGCLTGLVMTLLNPFWIVTSAIFGVQGTERLKKGDIDGARRSLFNGRFANWMMFLIGLVAWTVFLHYGEPGKRIHRMLHEPKVEVVQSATGSYAAKPASPSIRAEMRQALTGGHVLKVWNMTDRPATCVATLHSPELRTDPVYTFVAQPGAPKPQELGLMQFGHRIKKKPRCSVTIEVEGTGEVYRYTP